MSKKLVSTLLKQLRHRANEIEYEIETDYNRDKAVTLSWLYYIEDKRKINFEFPDKDLCGDEISEILNKNL